MFVFVSNVIKLVREIINVIVVNVKSSSFLVVMEVFLKNFSNIFPLSDEFMSFLGMPESSINLFKIVNLTGLSPSLEGCLKVSDWCRVLDFLHGDMNILGLLGDGFLSSWGDLDLKLVDEFLVEFLCGDGSEEKCDGSEFHVCFVLFLKNIFKKE